MSFFVRYLRFMTNYLRGLNVTVCVSALIVLGHVYCCNPVFSQEVIEFKGVLSEANYIMLLEMEQAVIDETDRIQQAQMLVDLATKAHIYNHKLSKNIYVRAIDSIRALPNDSLLAHALSEASNPYIRMGKYEEASDFIYEALEYYQSQEDSLGMASCFRQYAFLERSRSRYYTALDYLYQARSIQESFQSLHEMWSLTNRTMISYELLGDYDSAIELGEEFVDAARSQDELPYGYYTVIRNLAEAYFKNDNITKAKEYMAESLPKWIATGSPKYMTESYSLMFTVALAENEAVLAKNYADSLLKYAPRVNSTRLESFAHLSQYRINDRLSIDDNQGYHIRQAYQKAIEANHDASILDAAEHYSEYAYANGNIQEAYSKRILADSLRKQIYSKEISTKLDDLERQLLLQKSQNEIALLDQQNKSKEESLLREKNLRWILVALLVAALLSAGLFMGLLRQRSKHNAILTEKNDIITNSLEQKDTLINEVHHRVKNNLQIVSSLLNLQIDYIEDENALEAINNSKQRVETMALVHRFLYRKENIRTVYTQEYFEKLSSILLDANHISSKDISIHTDIADIQLGVDTVIPLGLIVHELLVNSIKYAFKHKDTGQIKFVLKQLENNNLNLSISDNGSGIQTDLDEALSSSFGWELINSLSNQLRGELSVSNTNGLLVSLTVPNHP